MLEKEHAWLQQNCRIREEEAKREARARSNPGNHADMSRLIAGCGCPSGDEAIASSEKLVPFLERSEFTNLVLWFLGQDRQYFESGLLDERSLVNVLRAELNISDEQIARIRAFQLTTKTVSMGDLQNDVRDLNRLVASMRALNEGVDRLLGQMQTILTPKQRGLLVLWCAQNGQWRDDHKTSVLL